MGSRTNTNTREVLPGVTLVRRELGGLEVVWNGASIGWIHASLGDRWNAYAIDPGKPFGIPLGSYLQDRAVEMIAIKAGWPASEPGS